MSNERDLGVKNGFLGIIEGIEHGVFFVKLDGLSTRVHVDTKFYKHLDYGYGATVHKAQGSTGDRSYVLASITLTATPPTSRYPAIAITPLSFMRATISAEGAREPPRTLCDRDSRRP